MISVYSGFGLDRCRCISKQLWTRCLSLKLMTKTITKLMKTRCKFNSEQVSDCSLIQSEQCNSYIMARTSYIRGDEKMIMPFCTRSKRLVRFLSSSLKQQSVPHFLDSEPIAVFFSLQSQEILNRPVFVLDILKRV